MATAVVYQARDSETFAPAPFDDTRFIFLEAYSDTSSYKSYAATVATHNVGSEIMGDLEDEIEETPQPRNELNSELPLEESSNLDEQQALDCKIPKNLLLKLKSYIFIHSQKEEEFSLDDLQKEFNDKFEVPSNVDLEYELQRMGIVVLKYAQYKMKMTPKPQFLADYARQKSNVQVKPSQIFGLKINLTIPDDALTQTDTIEVENLPQLECGDSFGAYISVSNDPQDFFIQLKTTESVLHTTMNDLDDVYTDMELSTKYKINEIQPGIIGLHCAALYCNKSTGKSEGWHRGIIVEIYDNESVEVYYIDFGTKTRVDIDYVRFLDKRFGKAKAQAINVKLGGIKPKRSMKGVEPYWTWQAHNAFKIFANETNNNYYYGQGVTCILMTKRPNRKPELLIYDTITNELPDGISINNVLVRDGYAKKDPKWTKHGLLPWEYPCEQLRQTKMLLTNELGAALAEVTVEADQSVEKVELEIPPEYIKESVDKVKLWLIGQKSIASEGESKIEDIPSEA